MLESRPSPKQIAVIGELNVDLIASGLERGPALGFEILARDFEITLGSASAIFACGAATLGNEVTFISRVGRDEFGNFCIDALQKKGISTGRVEASDGEKTGLTFVLSTQQDRAMVTYPGAMANYSFEDIPLDALSGLHHLHLTSYFLQTGLKPDFSRLMNVARQHGLTVSFDPNSDPSGKWNEEIIEIINGSNILFLNELEALQLTSQTDVIGAVKSLASKCPCVVIKLGPNGAIAIREGNVVSAGGFSVPTIDTTGAGDSFDAGFVHGFLNEMSLLDCLLIGNACGALSTTKAGGTNAQANYSEVLDLIENAKQQDSKTAIAE
ncbi:MAG TPA: carbohydrate kinase family protein [Pyrinomonadaceae bacterium]|nr:carbohydrate kinase family protein [Pyrinomonadaceae bacterium]